MSVAICHGDHGLAADGSEIGPHCPLELFASSGHDVPVRADQGPDGYELSGFYFDGVKGVSDADMIEAECDESPGCPLCMVEINHWQHGA